MVALGASQLEREARQLTFQIVTVAEIHHRAKDREGLGLAAGCVSSSRRGAMEKNP